MTSSPIDLSPVRAKGVGFGEETLIIEPVDGRVLTVPIAWYPCLAHGTPLERTHWELIGGGRASTARTSTRSWAWKTFSWGVGPVRLRNHSRGGLSGGLHIIAAGQCEGRRTPPEENAAWWASLRVRRPLAASI